VLVTKESAEMMRGSAKERKDVGRSPSFNVSDIDTRDILYGSRVRYGAQFNEETMKDIRRYLVRARSPVDEEEEGLDDEGVDEPRNSPLRLPSTGGSNNGGQDGGGMEEKPYEEPIGTLVEDLVKDEPIREAVHSTNQQMFMYSWDKNEPYKIFEAIGGVEGVRGNSGTESVWGIGGAEGGRGNVWTDQAIPAIHRVNGHSNTGLDLVGYNVGVPSFHIQPITSGIIYNSYQRKVVPSQQATSAFKPISNFHALQMRGDTDISDRNEGNHLLGHSSLRSVTPSSLIRKHHFPETQLIVGKSEVLGRRKPLISHSSKPVSAVHPYVSISHYQPEYVQMHALERSPADLTEQTEYLTEGPRGTSQKSRK